MRKSIDNIFASKKSNLSLEEGNKNAFWENLKTVFLAILIALIIRSFLIEPFRIPSHSMYPTLRVGDYLFVTKYTYGYSRYSFPGGFPIFKGRIWYSEPKHGDVVVFKFPKNTHTDFIKRIIGLPGDKVQMKDGRLYINNEKVERQERGRYIIDEYLAIPEFYHKYTENLPNGVKHKIIELSDNERIVDNTEEFEVPQDMIFVMGDNRGGSSDSRDRRIGLIKESDIKGKATFRLWPLNHFGFVK